MPNPTLTKYRTDINEREEAIDRFDSSAHYNEDQMRNERPSRVNDYPGARHNFRPDDRFPVYETKDNAISERARARSEAGMGRDYNLPAEAVKQKQQKDDATLGAIMRMLTEKK